ncbi:MAG: hypothetical protein ABF289_06905 [Clostridiales bacterium]
MKKENVFSYLILIFAVVSSLVPILNLNIYNDNDFIKIVWFGNDLVTLFLMVPVFLISLIKNNKGSHAFRLIWLGCVWYMLYNYVFYLFGAAFNSMFLFYVLIVACSIWTLIFGLYNTNAEKIRLLFKDTVPIKFVVTCMFLLGGIISLLWITMSLRAILSGTIPPQVQTTGHITAIVFAIDLTLLVPPLFISGILLLKKHKWGYISSVIVLVKAFSYSLVLLVVSLITYQKTSTLEPLLGLWLILSMLVLFSLIGMLKNLKTL